MNILNIYEEITLHTKTNIHFKNHLKSHAILNFQKA